MLLRIEEIKTAPGEGPEALRGRAAAALRLRPEDIETLRVLRRAVDARGEARFVWTLAVSLREGAPLSARRLKAARAAPWAPESYRLPEARGAPPARPPVVVGAGPAGLFGALVLASCGAAPILLERGACVEERARAVRTFWEYGVLDPASNVQFGEGGAGAFSDGKLNTGTRDARPHVGTDRLFDCLRAMRRALLSRGAQIRFGQRLADLEIENGRLRALLVDAPEGRYRLETRHLLLAPGHSARDTFAMLAARGVPLEAKPFAVGVRIEHRQSDIDAAQYRTLAGHPALPPAGYQLACRTAGGRGVFSFCVCPGGRVVAAASEAGGVVTNGMSDFARDGENINGGLLVSVTPADFGGGAALSGIAFQRRLERSAYRLGGGGFYAPAQLAGDFLAGRPSTGAGGIRPGYRPGVRFCDLHDCLPPFVSRALEEALPLLDRKLKGFAAPDAVLTAVESRSSSPVRIPRGEDGQSALRGLYPAGEGAGYAGGIMSAAADGMRLAERILDDIARDEMKGDGWS